MRTTIGRSLTRFALLAALAPGLATALAAPPAAPPAPAPAAAPKPATPTIADGRRLLGQQKFAEAASVFEAITDANPDDAEAWLLRGFAWHGAGDLGRALPAHLMAAEFPRTRALGRYNIACVYALKGRTDDAFTWLHRARNAGMNDLPHMQQDPDLASLRTDPRWATFIESGSIRTPDAGADDPDAITPMRGDPATLPPARRLDFWVGDWVVLDPQGRRIGTNRIELAHGGHAVVEHWTSANGGTGTSLSYLDPARRRWHQTWIDGSGAIIVKDGAFTDGAMRMTGTRTLPDGAIRTLRTELRPLRNGSVRQFIEESTDDGATWTTWFDGTYVRAGQLGLEPNTR